MKIDNRIIGALAVLGGAAIVYAVRDYPPIPGQLYSSDFFPRLVGFAIMGLGLAIVITNLRQGALSVGMPAWFADKSSALRVMMIFLSVVLWIVLTPLFGFIIVTTVLQMVLFILLGMAFKNSVVVALLSTLGMYGLFFEMLYVPLPMGLAEEAIQWMFY